MLYIVDIEPVAHMLYELEHVSESCLKRLIDYALWRAFVIDTNQYALIDEEMRLACAYKQPLEHTLVPIATLSIGSGLDTAQTLVDGDVLWVKLTTTQGTKDVIAPTQRSNQHRLVDRVSHGRRLRSLSRQRRRIALE